MVYHAQQCCCETNRNMFPYNELLWFIVAVLVVVAEIFVVSVQRIVMVYLVAVFLKKIQILCFRTTNCYGLSMERLQEIYHLSEFPYNELLWFICKLKYRYLYLSNVSVQRIVMVYLS